MFTDAVFRRDDDAEPLSVTCANILLEVEAPTLRRDEVLAVVGDAEELGRWDVAHSVIMNDAAAPVWRVLLPTRTAGAEWPCLSSRCAAGRIGASGSSAT